MLVLVFSLDLLTKSEARISLVLLFHSLSLSDLAVLILPATVPDRNNCSDVCAEHLPKAGEYFSYFLLLVLRPKAKIFGELL